MGRLLFSFQGRTNRAPYWGLSIAQAVVLIVAIGVMTAVGPTVVVVAAVALVLMVVVIVSSLAVSIRRLHDRNRSGWWALLYFGLNAIASELGTGEAFAALPQPLRIASTVVSFAIALAALVDLGILQGTRGANRFGPDPLGRVAAEVFD